MILSTWSLVFAGKYGFNYRAWPMIAVTKLLQICEVAVKYDEDLVKCLAVRGLKCRYSGFSV